MNKLNTPIKYTLGIWKDLEGYPSKEDVLFEIVQHVEKRQQKNFTRQTLEPLWKDDPARPQKEEILADMIADGTVITDGAKFRIERLFD